MPGNGQPVLDLGSRAPVDAELEYLVREAENVREDLGLPSFLGVLPTQARNLVSVPSLSKAAPIRAKGLTRLLRGSGRTTIMAVAGVIAAGLGTVAVVAMLEERYRRDR